MKYKYDSPLEGRIGPEKYFCSIVWRNGIITADEPVSAGGTDQGPDPHSLLLASLASCTMITLRMYIDRKGWTIPEVRVKVNMFKDPTNNDPVIDCDIEVPLDVDDEKRVRLREIAGHCPVSKILENPTKVRTFMNRNPADAKTIDYKADGINIHWKPDVCQHSTRCFKQLPSVFNPREKKWVNVDGATPEEILAQVKRCPSGALTASLS